MRKALFIFFLFLSVAGYSSQKEDQIRILKLYPYLVQPPLVEPALPVDFVLGERDDDPYFSQGYFWGTQGSLHDYFESPSALKGCLIRSQVATSVKQVGFDRFSNDHTVSDLTAAGFTEIKVSRGKWGIFPSRELVAKGPKGRKYYQLWVGLNTKEGTALCYQFLYPEYLSEPTQHQKQIWDNFVRKTDLLSMEDLLIARAAQIDREPSEKLALFDPSLFKVEKRKLDQKFFIRLESEALKGKKMEVIELRELPLLNPYTPGKPCVEIVARVDGKDPEEKTIRSSYHVVDHFSFDKTMLCLRRFTENDSYLIFQ
ncbi:MAG: hypothetical protein KDK71_09480 [Chlamydiia bacterium]|nr:hypothetical protein [Chlamydiia bacterium]